MRAPFTNDIHVYVKNVGDTEVVLPEIEGYPLQPDEEIDLMEEREGYGYYDNYRFVMRAANDLEDTVLYQGTHADPPYLVLRQDWVS